MRMFRSLEIGDRSFGWVVLLAFLAFLVHKPAVELFDDVTTPQPWFDVSIDVFKDQEGGWNVRYKRQINRSVRGVWSARVFKIGEPKGIPCSGSEYAHYKTYTSGTIVMTLDDFVGDDDGCDLQPGRYELCASYLLRNDDDRQRSFGPVCTRFNVAP